MQHALLVLNCMAEAALQSATNAGNLFPLQSCQSGGTIEGRGLQDNGKPCLLLKGFTKGGGVLQPGPAPQPHLPHAAHQQVAMLLFLSGTEQLCCYRISLFCDNHSEPAHTWCIFWYQVQQSTESLLFYTNEDRIMLIFCACVCRAAALISRDWVGDAMWALKDCEIALKLEPSLAKAHYRQIQALKALNQMQASCWSRSWPQLPLALQHTASLNTLCHMSHSALEHRQGITNQVSTAVMVLVTANICI